jgi:hypothetical protein
MFTLHRFALAAALALLSAGPTLGSDADRVSLYPTLSVLGFFGASVKDEMKSELKVTASQEKAIKAGEERRHKLWVRYCEDSGKIQKTKLSEREKNTKLRALDTRLADDLFKDYGQTLSASQVKRMKQIALQVRGMEIFDHPEVREALKIGDKEVKTLHTAWDKMAREMAEVLKANVAAKRMTGEEAARIAWSMRVSVPEKVRESLNEEQKKVLEDYLGEKYTYKN